MGSARNTPHRNTDNTNTETISSPSFGPVIEGMRKPLGDRFCDRLDNNSLPLRQGDINPGAHDDGRSGD